MIVTCDWTKGPDDVGCVGAVNLVVIKHDLCKVDL